MKNELKLLVAVDGSEQSLNAAEYAATTFPARSSHVVLFNVRPSVPESFLDVKKTAPFRST